MTALSEQDMRAALEFVRCCETTPDLPAYRTAVLRLRDDVSGHLISYNEVDLVEEALVSDLEPSELRFDGDWDIFGRYAHQHPVIRHHDETGDLHPRALSDFLSVDELHALELYDQFYRRMEVEDQIAFGLPSTAGLVLGVAISRRQRGFSERDRAFLSLVAPHAGDAYLAARLRTTAHELLGGARAPGLEHVAVLTADDRADWLSAGADELLRRYLGAGIGRHGELPDTARDYVRRARRRTAAPEGLHATPERLAAEADGSLLRGQLIRAIAPGEQDVLLLDERPDPLARPRLLARGLTDRETDVVRLVADGLTNPEIAERLAVSASTVKRHMENVYAKLGVGTRAGVVGRLLRG